MFVPGNRITDFQSCDVLWSSPYANVCRLASRPPERGWTPAFPSDSFGFGLPVIGAFRRKADGTTQYVSSSVGFLRRPDEEVQIAQAGNAMTAYTFFELDLGLLGLGEGDWLAGAIHIAAPIELQHRVLLRQIDSEGDSCVVEELFLGLLDSCLGQRLDAFRPAASHRAIDHSSVIAEVCVLLAAVRGDKLSLVEIARNVGFSPFHLSRTFRRTMGMTLSQYRIRLRVSAVIDRLLEGESDLAALASQTGFSDHSHMTRTVVEHVGTTPSSVRRMLLEDSRP